MDKREANARYYAAHSDRIILRESELRPSTILELIDCLGELDLHPHDKRLERLEQLFFDLTGTEASHSSASGERRDEVSI
jgi:hypothetical protein